MIKITARKVTAGALKGSWQGVIRVFDFDSGRQRERFMYHFGTGIDRLTREDAIQDAEDSRAELNRCNVN